MKQLVIKYFHSNSNFDTITLKSSKNLKEFFNLNKKNR